MTRGGITIDIEASDRNYAALYANLDAARFVARVQVKQAVVLHGSNVPNSDTLVMTGPIPSDPKDTSSPTIVIRVTASDPGLATAVLTELRPFAAMLLFPHKGEDIATTMPSETLRRLLRTAIGE